MSAGRSPRLLEWVERYERAWRTAGTSALAGLFTADAIYLAEPFAEPLAGLDAIAEFWESERDGPDESFSMTAEVVAEQDRIGVARIEVVYGDPPTRRYRDLWVVTLDADGRAARFDEWPFFPGRGRVAPPDAR